MGRALAILTDPPFLSSYQQAPLDFSSSSASCPLSLGQADKPQRLQVAGLAVQRPWEYHSAQHELCA